MTTYIKYVLSTLLITKKHLFIRKINLKRYLQLVADLFIKPKQFKTFDVLTTLLGDISDFSEFVKRDCFLLFFVNTFYSF